MSNTETMGNSDPRIIFEPLEPTIGNPRWDDYRNALDKEEAAKEAEGARNTLAKEEVVPRLLYNAIRTPDGTVLQSRSGHDYVTHTDTIDGKFYMVDGGLEYIRRSIDGEDLSLTDHDSHYDVREVFSWGTYGIDGDQPLSWVLLKDMSDAHIGAVLKTQNLAPQVKEMFETELKIRNE